MKRFFDSYSNRPVPKKEKFSGKTRVEQNCISTQRRINEMLVAGVRLNALREEQFDDFSQGEPDFDPTRAKNFDPAELQGAINRVKEGYRRKIAKKAQSKAVSGGKPDTAVNEVASKVTNGAEVK